MLEIGHGNWFDSIKRSYLDALLFEFTLFAEDAAAHLEDGFESFAANLGILTESIHACLLNLVLDLLPSTAKSSDFSFLAELGGGVRVERGLLIGNGLAHAEDVRPCEIGGTHCHLLCDRVDIGDFIDVGGIRSAED